MKHHSHLGVLNIEDLAFMFTLFTIIQKLRQRNIILGEKVCAMNYFKSNFFYSLQVTLFPFIHLKVVDAVLLLLCMCACKLFSSNNIEKCTSALVVLKLIWYSPHIHQAFFIIIIISYDSTFDRTF